MEPIIEVKDVVKVFGPVRANDGVSLSILPGEVHVLLGENGAGKSTLMKILYGIYKPDSGHLFYKGKEVQWRNPSDAIEAGIGMVHQHFMQFEPFTVAESLALGNEPGLGIFLDRKAAARRVKELSEHYGFSLRPEAVVEELSVGERQRLEILKELNRSVECLILDEPTAVLTPQETQDLFRVFRQFVAEGKTVIFITHKLREALEVSDRITVLRSGKVVGTVPTREATVTMLSRMLAGEQGIPEVVREFKEPGDLILKISGMVGPIGSTPPALKGLDLEVYKGEILGIAGVEGNGQAELVDVITGLASPASGEMWFDGQVVSRFNPAEAMRAGIGYIPEDRLRQGAVPTFSVAQNIILGYHGLFTRYGFIDFAAAYNYGAELVERFNIRTPSLDFPTGKLSGGNLQKVILARIFGQDPKLVIACQVTRGLDISASAFVHQQLVEARNRGKGVILISADLDELMTLSDRLAVIYAGKIQAVRPVNQYTKEELSMFMTGAGENRAGDGIVA